METTEEIVRQSLETVAKNLIEKIKENMSSYGLGDSALAQSLNYRIIQENGNFSIEILSEPYWDYAQKGHPPGRKYRSGVKYGLSEGHNTISGVPYDFEDIIRSWGKSSEEYISAIKWKTIREGSYLYRHPEEHRDFIQNAVDTAIGEINELLRESVKSSIKLP